MTTQLTLQSIIDGQSATITTIECGVLSFGREPENSVVVDSDAVSRQHACIGNVESQWVFWDLGSSNGSWINGKKIEEDQIVLLRVGDVVQLADFVFRIADSEGNVPVNGVKPLTMETSLLLFENGEFVREIQIDKIDSQFVIGGSESDVEFEEPRGLVELTIVKTATDLELSVGVGASGVQLNGSAVAGKLSLADRDQITALNLSVVVNKPTSDLQKVSSPSRFATPEAAPSELNQVAAYDRYHLPKHLSGKDEDWQSEAGRRHVNRGKKFIFGGGDNADETRVEYDASSSAQPPKDPRFGRGLSTLHQASLGSFSSERTLAQRVAIAVSVLLLLMLFAWALSNMLASS